MLIAAIAQTDDPQKQALIQSPSVMEVEKAIDPVIEDKREIPALDQTQDTIGDLINEAKEEAEAHTNCTRDAANGRDSMEKELQRSESPVNDTASHDKPSQRVREGQRWNDRPRKYDNKNDRKPHKYDNKHDRAQYKKNIRSDLTSQQESNDPVAIRKQVEFYFSDSNLLQDKFLFTKVEGHKNLPVPISVIHSFKRMRHFQPLSAIVDALKESNTLNLVEDDTCIERKEALPEGLVGKPMVEIKKVHEDRSMARSIYAKGFGAEGPSTQFDIEAFFAKYGSTNSVRLRRLHPEQTFKGSVFVEFDSESTQKAFLDLDPKPKWQGKELEIKSKKQYCDDKVDDIKAGKVRPNGQDDPQRHQYRTHDSNRRDSPNYDRGGRSGDKDNRDWRTRRDEDQKSGFIDRNGGKHPGFGSSGRGDRGHRDRNGEQIDRDERGVPKINTTTLGSADQVSPGTNTLAETPKDDQVSDVQNGVLSSAKNGERSADTSMAPPPTVSATAEDSTSTNGGSKKRVREEDDISEGQGSAKKIDTKGAES